MSKINIENYFEYAEAIHCFCSLNHGGMGCKLYSILSKGRFKPGVFWSETKVERENRVFSEINEENVEELFEELENFLVTGGV